MRQSKEHKLVFIQFHKGKCSRIVLVPFFWGGGRRGWGEWSGSHVIIIGSERQCKGLLAYKLWIEWWWYFAIRVAVWSLVFLRLVAAWPSVSLTRQTYACGVGSLLGAATIAGDGAPEPRPHVAGMCLVSHLLGKEVRLFRSQRQGLGKKSGPLSRWLVWDYSPTDSFFVPPGNFSRISLGSPRTVFLEIP